MPAQTILDDQARQQPIANAGEGEKGQASGAMPADVVQQLVQLFKLFSDETRLRILHFLMHQDELNVRTLCEMLGQSQPAVSHHLALLRVAGLIECRRDGKHNFYHIMPGRIQELIEMMFRTAPDQASRICFESFVLSYQPTAVQEGRGVHQCRASS